MTTPDVVLYVTGWCPYCSRATALLDRKAVTSDAMARLGEKAAG